jgi:hypothetical protein
MTSLKVSPGPAASAGDRQRCGEAEGWPKRSQTAVVDLPGKLAAGSLAPIGPARADARYRQANERYREDGDDDLGRVLN